jgi:tetratricopeptide (TPR) repeat protein
MKLLVFFSFLLIPFICIHGQDVNSLIAEGNRIEAIPDEMGAFHKYREVLKIQPLNIYALTRCSELCSRIAKRQTIPKVRDDYYYAAKTYAGIALKINPNSSDANCAMAMVLGRSSLAKSGKEKIENAREVKKYVDIAIKNDPQNFKAWHILGRWHYEISNLSMLERAAVKLLYGGVPPASIKESIDAFERAKAIAPGFVLNYFEMARAYKQNEKEEKAISYINLMLTLPNQTEDDPAIKENGRALLQKWK